MDFDNATFDGDEIPPYLRKPPAGSRELAEMLLSAINHRLEWLDSRGLRPHAGVITRRTDLVQRLNMHWEAVS